MKYCPQCQTEYTDDGLRFCKRDGTPLVNSNDAPTVNFGEEATVVSSRQVEPIRVAVENQPPIIQQPPQNYWQQSAPPIIAAPPSEKKSRTGLAVALTALGMLALFAIVGVGVMFYMRGNRNTEIALNVNNAPANRPSNANAPVVQNLNVNTATPTATPTAKPTLDPKESKAATENVGGVIDKWADSTESRDLDAHMSQYADTVDYYKAGKVSAARVKADRERAFDMYDSMTVNISNVKITPDVSGSGATAIIDKEWNFSGEEKFSTGKVQQQLTFAKIGGKWLITGEKDLKLYYKE